MEEIINKSFSGDSSEVVIHTHLSTDPSHYEYDNLLYVMMLSGNKRIEMDGEALTINKGDLLMTSSKISADVTCEAADLNNPTVCATLEIDTSKVGSILEKVNEEYQLMDMYPDLPFDGPSLYHINSSQDVFQSVNKLKNLHASSNLFKDKLISLATEELILKTLQSEMYSTLVDNYLEQLHHHPLAFAIQYIKENLTTRINIDTLADKASMSRATFFRQFRQLFGMSPIAYINTERIKLAQKMLKDTSFSISEICYSLGYTSPSYFNKQFRLLQGTSPGEFRSTYAATKTASN